MMTRFFISTWKKKNIIVLLQKDLRFKNDSLHHISKQAELSSEPYLNQHLDEVHAISSDTRELLPSPSPVLLITHFSFRGDKKKKNKIRIQY